MKNVTNLCNDERKAKLKEFCASLGITMHRYELLNLALTHTSYAHETVHYPHNEHNERLEFLGDSVLSLIVSTYLYQNFPSFDEGKMTKLRAQIVCETSLYQCAKRMNLGKYLRMGNGERASGGTMRPSILADAFEAVLGAYYLDQGFAAAKKYLLGLLEEEIKGVCSGLVMMGDYKSMLQEFCSRLPRARYLTNCWDSQGRSTTVFFLPVYLLMEFLTAAAPDGPRKSPNSRRPGKRWKN